MIFGGTTRHSYNYVRLVLKKSLRPWDLYRFCTKNYHLFKMGLHIAHNKSCNVITLFSRKQEAKWINSWKMGWNRRLFVPETFGGSSFSHHANVSFLHNNIQRANQLGRQLWITNQWLLCATTKWTSCFLYRWVKKRTIFQIVWIFFVR
jgi:hypothetical protein